MVTADTHIVAYPVLGITFVNVSMPFVYRWDLGMPVDSVFTRDPIDKDI